MNNVHTKEIKFDKEWVESIDKAFDKVKKNVEVDGFRKGKVSKEIFLKNYGVESLYETAIDILLNKNRELYETYEDCVLETRPIIDIKDVDENSITIEFKYISEPTVTLGEYKNLGLKVPKVKVTDEDIEKEIKSILNELAEHVIVDKKIENGDTAVIDFAGTIDGEVLEGGTGFGHELEIGSNSFIPGFEEALIGLMTGEEKEVKLKFPDDYHAEDIKGKDVVFAVTIKEVKELKLPEMNEELFKDAGYEVKTEEEFKKLVKEDLIEEKTETAENEMVNEMFEKCITGMKVEINEEIIEEEISHIISEIEENIKAFGADIDTYCKAIGKDINALREESKSTAVSRLEMKYFLKAVAKEEKIEATKEEIDDKLVDYCEHFEQDIEKHKENAGLIKHIETSVIMEKTAEFLKENNK